MDLDIHKEKLNVDDLYKNIEDLVSLESELAISGLDQKVALESISILGNDSLLDIHYSSTNKTEKHQLAIEEISAGIIAI